MKVASNNSYLQVHSCLTYAVNKEFLETNIRVKPDLDALGALGDVGWYCIRAILWAANYDLPKSVVALRGTVFNDAGVILSCSASMHWEDGKLATFHCSFSANVTMDVNIVGTNGTLRFHDFVIPMEEGRASYVASSRTWFNENATEWEPKPKESIVTTEMPQEALMVSEFCRLVGSVVFDGKERERKWGLISRETQLVLDAVKVSIERNCGSVDLY